MEIPKILDRISFQLDSFQEGFEILSKARSLEEMAKNFSKILRGNLLTTNVNVFHKSNRNQPWKGVYVTSSQSLRCINNYQYNSNFHINFLKNQEYKVCSILPLIDKSLFGIIIGKKLDKTEYTTLDKITLQIFFQLLDNAYQFFINRKKEKDLIFTLNQKILQLNSMIDTGIEISKSHEENFLFNLALKSVISLTNASRGMLEIVSSGLKKETIYFPNSFKIVGNENIIKTEFEFKDSLHTFTLVDKESRDGFIPFDDTDQSLLDALSRQVHVALENHHLHLGALEKQKIEQELSVAASIQKAIIPNTVPHIDGYDIYGINIPSKEIGGDYYDCIKLKNGKYALIMADVSGKGISAALLVSSLHASLQAYLHTDFSLIELAQKLNKVIYESSTTDTYVTFFIAVLEPISGQVESLNAGHNPSFIIRKNNEIIQLKNGGVPFGFIDWNYPYQSEQSILDIGDRLILYTDGIPEAMNQKGKFYEDKGRFEKFILNNNGNARNFINNLVTDVKKFTGKAPQSDDITALYLKCQVR